MHSQRLDGQKDNVDYQNDLNLSPLLLRIIADIFYFTCFLYYFVFVTTTTFVVWVVNLKVLKKKGTFLPIFKRGKVLVILQAKVLRNYN